MKPVPAASARVLPRAGASAQLLYRVALSCEADGDRRPLGEWVGLAEHAARARQLGMETHWDDRLDGADVRAVVACEQLLRYVSCESWTHIFDDAPRGADSHTRWVIDRATKAFVRAQILSPEDGQWRDLSRMQAQDLMESLTENFDLMDSQAAVDFGLELGDELAPWALHAGDREGRGFVPAPVEVSYGEEQVGQVADSFLRGLLDEIGLLRLHEVAEANEAEINPGICHTHDACDANVVMASAMQPVIGMEVDLRASSQAALWDAAWATARQKMQAFVDFVIDRRLAWYGASDGFVATRGFDSREELDAWNSALAARCGRGVDLLVTGPAIIDVNPAICPNPVVASLANDWDQPTALRAALDAAEQGMGLSLDAGDGQAHFECAVARELLKQRLLELDIVEINVRRQGVQPNPAMRGERPR